MRDQIDQRIISNVIEVQCVQTLLNVTTELLDQMMKQKKLLDDNNIKFEGCQTKLSDMMSFELKQIKSLIPTSYMSNLSNSISKPKMNSGEKESSQRLNDQEMEDQGKRAKHMTGYFGVERSSSQQKPNEMSSEDFL